MLLPAGGGELSPPRGRRLTLESSLNTIPTSSQSGLQEGVGVKCHFPSEHFKVLRWKNNLLSKFPASTVEMCFLC